MDPLNAFLERYRLTAAAEVADEFVTHKHDASDIMGPFGDVTITGDIWSSNWDGDVPADLSAGPDATASAGFYLDSSAGAIQGQAIYAEGGELGTLTVEEVVYSTNWDGVVPPDLSGGKDATAAAGFAFDGASGAIQVMNIFAEGGELHDLDITGTLDFVTGGILRTASDGGQRIEIRTANKDRILFYSGFVNETLSGHMETGNISGEAAIKIQSPTETKMSWIKLAPSEIRFKVGDGEIFRFTEDGADFLMGDLNMADGSSIWGYTDWLTGGFWLEGGDPALLFDPGIWSNNPEGDPDTQVPAGWGYVMADDLTGTHYTPAEYRYNLRLVTPQRGRASGGSYVDMSQETSLRVTDFHSTHDAADATLFAIEKWLGVTAQGFYLGLTANYRLYLGADYDTYLQWVGADNWAFYVGGHKVLDLTHNAANLSAATVQIQDQTVTFGANDSAVAGYRHVMVPNTA